MKAPDTKTILNISLAIGIFIVGKKLMETFGLLKTEDDKIADELTIFFSNHFTVVLNILGYQKSSWSASKIISPVQA